MYSTFDLAVCHADFIEKAENINILNTGGIYQCKVLLKKSKWSYISKEKLSDDMKTLLAK